MKHLLNIDQFDAEQIHDILDVAESYIHVPGNPVLKCNQLADTTVANLFFEPSTRTRSSFYLAAQQLGANVLDIDVNSSSHLKGESTLDTIYTLQAMNVNVFVIRSDMVISKGISSLVSDHVSVINAGEGSSSHPTQGLLDLMTIRQHKGSFEGLKVAIVGDLLHSRVARSAISGLSIMGVSDIRLISPRKLSIVKDNCIITESVEEGLQDADVVMVLRIQRERLDDSFNLGEYSTYFCVTQDRMKFAKPDAIVMHPGPMNRGIEIESSVADGEQSVILQQVTNGIAIRKAVLQLVRE